MSLKEGEKTRKFLVISIPVVTLAFFALIMLSANYLKKPLGVNDNVPELVQVVTNNIQVACF
jgi:hypothetical protein